MTWREKIRSVFPTATPSRMGGIAMLPPDESPAPDSSGSGGIVITAHDENTAILITGRDLDKLEMMIKIARS